MTGFEQRLRRVLSEGLAAPAGLRIVDVRFTPHRDGHNQVAWVLLHDGSSEPLFKFDPQQVQFTAQELVGLERRDARYLLDKKLDDHLGFAQF